MVPTHSVRLLDLICRKGLGIALPLFLELIWNFTIHLGTTFINIFVEQSKFWIDKSKIVKVYSGLDKLE